VLELPFDLPGRFWRGNLHTHSDHSDGALPPEQVAQIYRDAGYDFLAITDHFRDQFGYPVTDTRALRTPGFTTLIGAELHAPRTERSSEWHIIAAGLPLDFPPTRPGETGPELARRARDTGAFIGIAHPAASLLTLADAETLNAAHAIEVYNALSAWEDRGESWHFSDLLLGRGHRLGIYAADDAHFQPQDPPGCQAWIHLRAETLDPDTLLTALKAGHYYASTGPQIHHVQLDNDHIHIHCSPASRIVVTGSRPGKQLRAGHDLTEATLPLEMFTTSPYLRVTIVDTTDHRAWTNPIWRS
jgi:PHP domain-containing protein